MNRTIVLRAFLTLTPLWALLLIGDLNKKTGHTMGYSMPTGWKLGDGNNGYLSVSQVDFTAVTDVICFALVWDSDGTLNAADNTMTQAGPAALVNAAHTRDV